MRYAIVAAVVCACVSSTRASEDVDDVRRAIDALDRYARQQSTAREALLQYEQFKRANSVPEELQRRFKERFEQWQDRADKGLVRLGNKWVTPEEQQLAAEEARALMAEALQLLKFGDHEGARDKLLEASRCNRNGILPDYILGFLNSGRVASIAVSHPESAIKHFKTVLTRAPKHVGALNNLGVAYIKQGEVRRAIGYWEDAKELEPDNDLVKHNVRRTLYEQARGTIEIKRATLNRLRSMVAEDDASKELETRQLVWAISPVAVPDQERQPRPEEADTSRKQKVSAGATGTGFVIAPGYLVTNRHVVQHDLYGSAVAVRVIIPGDAAEEHVASVVGVADDHDLALLRCEDLEAPALGIRRDQTRLGTEVMAAGFPRIGLMGTGIKATRGAISGLPEPNHDRYLYDAALNPGNSGGPLLGPDGTVVAVNAAHYRIGQPISIGVPGRRTIEFVAGHLPGFSGVQSQAELPWPDVAELAAKSTALISVMFADAAPILANDEQAQIVANYFTDSSCAHCKGWGKVACPHPKCRGGGILTYHHYRAIMLQTDDLTVTQKRRRSYKNRCPTCSGSSAVSCRFCGGSGHAR